MRKLILFSVFIALSFSYLKGQFSCGMPEPGVDPPQTLSNVVCGAPASYTPFRRFDTPILNVRYVIHVIQDSKGVVPNFLDDDTTHQYFAYYPDDTPDAECAKKFACLLTMKMRLLSPSTLPYITADGDTVWPVTHQDSRIRYIPVGLFYHQDSINDSLWVDAHTNADTLELYSKYVTNDTNLTVTQRDSAIHLFLIEEPTFLIADSTKWGNSKGIASGLGNKQYAIVLNSYYIWKHKNYHAQGVNTTCHEFGHNLGLSHSNSGGASSCTPVDVNKNWKFNCYGTDYVVNGQGDTIATKPCSDNVMGYNDCQCSLTECQESRMRYNLLFNTGNLFDVVIRDWCSYHPNETITINAGDDITWSGTRYLWGDLVVKNGGRLTLLCKLHLPARGRIFVEPGGTLIVDGGEITNICTGQLWKGIEAWSTSSVGNILHGRVTLKNGALIEHAEIGVLLGKRSTTGGFLDPNVTAGILQANTTSIIRNCITGAYFTKAYTGSGNGSLITDCIFTRDANHRFPTTGLVPIIYHIRGTQGAANVTVTNNALNDQSPSGVENGSYGVFAQDAKIDVTNNTFTGLAVGVQFQNAASTYFPGDFTVSVNFFNGCKVGISVSGLWQNFQIIGNKVNNTAGSYNKNTATLMGIYATGAYGVTITNNLLKNCTYGAYLKECYGAGTQQNQLGLRFNRNTINNVLRCLQTEKVVEFTELDCNTFDKWGTLAQKGAAWWNIGQPYNTYEPGDDGLPVVGKPLDGLVNYFLTDIPLLPPQPYRDIVTEPLAGESVETVRFRYLYKRPDNNSPVCRSADIRPVYSVSSAGTAFPSLDGCVSPNGLGACAGGGGGSTGKTIPQLIVDLQNATTPKERRKIIGQIIRLLRNDDQNPIPFLATLNDVNVKQSLIPYFIANGNLGIAQNTINTLPVNDPARVYFQILLDLKTQDKGIKQASVGQAAQVLQIADMTNTHPLRHTARAFMRIYNDTIIQDALPPDPEGFGGKYEQDEEVGGGLYKQNDNSITLYPNPTNGSLTVSFSQNIDRPYRLQFTDLYGRVVFTQNLTSQENLLDLSALAQGVYAYTLFAPDGSVSKQGRLACR